MSPYIVTTKRSSIRHAVGTIREARDYVHDCCVGLDSDHHDAYSRHARAALALPESGGTVGPLPDGTVIEVEQVDLLALMGEDTRWNYTVRSILDAYNARQA